MTRLSVWLCFAQIKLNDYAMQLQIQREPAVVLGGAVEGHAGALAKSVVQELLRASQL